MDFCSTFGRSILPIFGLMDEFVWGDIEPPLLDQTTATCPTGSPTVAISSKSFPTGPHLPSCADYKWTCAGFSARPCTPVYATLRNAASYEPPTDKPTMPRCSPRVLRVRTVRLRHRNPRHGVEEAKLQNEMRGCVRLRVCMQK